MIGHSHARDEPRRSQVDLISIACVWPLACECLDIDLSVKPMYVLLMS